MKEMPILGQMQADPVSDILGTGYSRFSAACGIDGLAKTDGIVLDILAVESRNPGRGQFRNFIAVAKLAYAEIRVWECWNPLLAQALERYGFQPVREIHNGEPLTGYRWPPTAP